MIVYPKLGHSNDALASPYDKKATVDAVYKSNFSCGDPVSYKINYDSITNDRLEHFARRRTRPIAISRVHATLFVTIPIGPSVHLLVILTLMKCSNTNFFTFKTQ